MRSRRPGARKPWEVNGGCRGAMDGGNFLSVECNVFMIGEKDFGFERLKVLKG
jgi:hypothetical protein